MEEIEAEQAENPMDWLIINHEGRPYKYWTIFIVTLQVISSYIYAVLCAYRMGTYENVWMPLESVFLLDMLLHFILDYKSPSKEANYNIRNFEEIVAYYLRSTFYWDLLPLVPLQALRLPNNFQNVFFVIKLVRIRKGIMSVSIVEIVKSAKSYIERKNLHDAEVAHHE
jgi:hypothetical protein